MGCIASMQCTHKTWRKKSRARGVRMTKAVICMNEEQDFNTCVLQKQLEGFLPSVIVLMKWRLVALFGMVLLTYVGWWVSITPLSQLYVSRTVCQLCRWGRPVVARLTCMPWYWCCPGLKRMFVRFQIPTVSVGAWETWEFWLFLVPFIFA